MSFCAKAIDQPCMPLVLKSRRMARLVLSFLCSPEAHAPCTKIHAPATGTVIGCNAPKARILPTPRTWKSRGCASKSCQPYSLRRHKTASLTTVSHGYSFAALSTKAALCRSSDTRREGCVKRYLDIVADTCGVYQQKE